MAFVFVGPMVLLLAILVALPFFDAIRLSFTARRASNVTEWVGLANYTALWSDPLFRAGARNSIVFTIYSEIFKVGLGLAAALLLHNLRRGRALLTGLILLPWVIPTVVTAFAWRSIFEPLFGSLNLVINTLHLGPVLQSIGFVENWPAAWLAEPGLAMPAVVMVNVWKGIPFFTINFLAALKAIDSQLYEAAAVDGAGATRRFVHVTLPGLKYVIIVTTLLSSIWTFNNFDLVWLLTQGGPGHATAPYVLVAYEKAIQQLQFGSGAAVAIVLIPVSAILIFVLARYMRRSDRGMAGSRFDRLVSDNRRWFVLAAILAVAAVLYVLSSDILWKVAIIVAVILAAGLAVGWLTDRLATVGRGRRGVTMLSRVPSWVAMAGMLGFILGPLYWISVTAFKTDMQNTSQTSTLWPQPWTTMQFVNLFDNTPFGTWYKNTIAVAFVSTLVAVTLSATAGYALARLRFRGSQGLTGIVLLTYMMPGALLFIPLYQILSDLHVINNLWALIITYPTFTLPFAAWLLMGYFRSIPADLEEAALTDGATRLQAFWYIILPLARPALLAVGLFTLTNAWNEFLFAFVFVTNEGQKTLPVGMQSMIFGDVVPWGQLSAASILISLPVVLMYAYGQRLLTEGLTIGAVKG